MKRVQYTKEDLREDLDGVTDDDVIEQPEVDTPDEQAPTAAADVTGELEGEYKAIDDVDTGIEAATDAQNQLSELKSIAEENEESGRSMTPVEENTLNVAMESLHSSLGMVWVRPTMESVSYRGRRQEMIATMEAASNSIGAKMIAGFKKAMEAIMEFLMNLFRNNWVMKKYIDAMRKRAQALKGDRPNQEEMDESARAMSVEGKASAKSIEPMTKSAMSALIVTEKAIEHINKLNFTYTEKVESSVSSTFDPTNNMVKRYGGGNDANTYGFLTGDRGFVPHSYGAAMFGVKSVFKEVRQAHEPAVSAEVLTKSEMLVALRSAEDIVKEIGRVESKKSVIKNIISRITQTAAAVAGIYGGLVTKSAYEMTWNIGTISNVRRLLNSVISRMPLEAYKTAKALTDYVRHSLKHYKSDEPLSGERTHAAKFDLVDEEDDDRGSDRKPYKHKLYKDDISDASFR